MDALLTSSAWGICLITHPFSVSWSTFVATCVVLTHQWHVLCSFQLTVALPWWLTFGLCLDHLVLVVVWFCFVFSYQCSDRMFRFMFYAPQLWGMFSPAAISRVIRSSLPLALSPMSLIKMWSFTCSVGILPLHRRSIRFRSPAGATVVGRPPLLLRTQVLRKVASLSLDSLDCLLAVS